MKTEDKLLLAIEERDRTVRSMTRQVCKLQGTADYICYKLKKHGEDADAEILRLAVRRVWR